MDNTTEEKQTSTEAAEINKLLRRTCESIEGKYEGKNNKTLCLVLSAVVYDTETKQAEMVGQMGGEAELLPVIAKEVIKSVPPNSIVSILLSR